MKKTVIFAAATAALVGASGLAMAAKSWNLTGEEIARFDATVVDAICATTGDCPPDCGAGQRQLGLMTDEDKFILVSKNAEAFTGAADDLIEFCGKKVTVDGLFTANQGVRFFAVQFVKDSAEGAKWRGAKRWGVNWAERNGLDPASKKKNQWFRHDPRIKALRDRDGFLGLGAEEDKKFLADY